MSRQWTGNESVTITDGRLQGTRLAQSQVIAWLGVPYAQPPIGKLRWKAPRKLAPWEGIRSAQAYGDSSVQFFEGKTIGSEDCLYLNIWRPDHSEAALPVFVFAHGGGNLGGSGQDFRGEQLANATNSIIITINYRLGAMGFFRHPALRSGDPLDDSGNYGLLDLIHALKWVQINIASFGGNPENVTLAGQSAGARNSLAAYLSPLGEGLFHKLFVMSGGMTTASAEQGDIKANELLTALLINSGLASEPDEALAWSSRQSADTIAYFLYAQPADSFSKVLITYDTSLRMEGFPHLFEDGTVLPIGGFEQLQHKSFPALPMILGSTCTEFSIFTLFNPYFSAPTVDDLLAKVMEQKALYEAGVQYGSELNAVFNVEQTAQAIAEAVPNASIFAYRFCWGMHDGVIDPSIRLLLGAPHGVDIPFLTGDYTGMTRMFSHGIITEANEPGREKLSSLLRSYVQNFLHSGNPNNNSLPQWQQWSGNHEAPDILSLDASLEKIIVHMNSKLEPQEINYRMNIDERLQPEQRKWLEDVLLKGRFFRKD